jgi:GNAT superfamily N-acetyltransferase
MSAGSPRVSGCTGDRGQSGYRSTSDKGYVTHIEIRVAGADDGKRFAGLFVVPEHRRRGVGALLLTAVLRHASDLGLERIVLHPSEASIGFWSWFGFVAADELLLYRAAAGR